MVTHLQFLVVYLFVALLLLIICSDAENLKCSHFNIFCAIHCRILNNGIVSQN